MYRTFESYLIRKKLYCVYTCMNQRLEKILKRASREKEYHGVVYYRWIDRRSLLLFNVDVTVNVTEGQMQNRRPNVNTFISIIHIVLYLEYIYFVVIEIPP